MKFSLIWLIYALLSFVSCLFSESFCLSCFRSLFACTCQLVNLNSRSSSPSWCFPGKIMSFPFFPISSFYPLLYPSPVSPSCQYLSRRFSLSPSWKSPFLYWKIDTSVSFLNMLSVNLLPFLLFPRRESPRFSTSLPSFLYEFPSFSRRVSFPVFLIRYIPLFPPFLSLSLVVMITSSPCGNGFFSVTLPSLSGRLFPPHPFFHLIFPFRARVYIIMCTPFSLPFPSSVFMFYNMFHNQPLTYLFSFYSKINIEIFCLYRKKAYFCIRLAEEPEPVSLTYWKRILQVNGLNKKTPWKFWK